MIPVDTSVWIELLAGLTGRGPLPHGRGSENSGG